MPHSIEEQFLHAVAALEAAQAEFDARTMAPVTHREAREDILRGALAMMAECHGVHLQPPSRVNSNGEYYVIALKEPGSNPNSDGCGSFGDDLAKRLTRHKGRTGTSGASTLAAHNGWCYLNHFAAEAMVREYAQELRQAQAPEL